MADWYAIAAVVLLVMLAFQGYYRGERLFKIQILLEEIAGELRRR
jgi:hypothetical protein